MQGMHNSMWRAKIKKSSTSCWQRICGTIKIEFLTLTPELLCFKHKIIICVGDWAGNWSVHPSGYVRQSVN